MSDAYLVLIKKKELIAQNTLLLILDTSGLNYDYKPGQYADVTIERPIADDRYQNSRTFSFVRNRVAEHEAWFAFRLSDSGFKHNISGLKEGDTIWMSRPMGYLRAPEALDGPLLLLAGGIGIAPLIAISEAALSKHSGQAIYLIHSNSDSASLPFYDLCSSLAKTYDRLHYLPTLTREIPGDWPHVTGRISATMIQTNVPETHTANAIIVGSTGFTESMAEVTKSLAIPPARCFIEDFGTPEPKTTA